MNTIHWIPWVLASGAVLVALSIYPYTATAIAYRGSDNGLAYILLVMGVGIWNAMFAAQLLDQDPLVKGFFLSLSIVGASLAGLGWFLFAGTASSTTTVPNHQLIYGISAVFVGINIFLVITSPAHELYWVALAETTAFPAFAEITPKPLYWLQTVFLIVLFSAGTTLFAEAWKSGISTRYTGAYMVGGISTIVALVGSNLVYPGGMTVAPLAAAALTTVGWLQANRGCLFAKCRSYLEIVELP
ncbi:histidine kinase N-terminal 7TM domain-containing protein [Natrinema salifodinae]|uniref:N-terminal 7TM region of histidine kinase n=1 Tax=Natrinema salifodinae TaxID=1202768 RepID=A0A1I0LZX1_9EURY|nr:histidine kinase N-terminal 7TM domain-containing protein [Natrinema salifodinae]SEV81668.1 N-terminal 7TM region of histidine kinase [Natrinema salifodinae]